MEVEMKIKGLMIDPVTSMPIIILRDLEEKDTLPIWIGVVEASSIAMQLEKIKIPRPLTHDLLKNILEQLQISVVKIEVTDLRDNTFYALIHLNTPSGVMAIDSRPSDAIALALRTESPIFVEEKVLEKSRSMEKESGFSEENKEKWREILENLRPEDFGKYKQ